MIETKSLPDWGPFQMEARLYHDDDSSPDDAECYTPKQVQAYADDEWSFVGLEVVVLFNHRTIGSDSLWGIEHGWIPFTDEADNLMEDPVQFYSVLEDAGVGSILADVMEQACVDAVSTIEQLQTVEIPA